MLRPAIPEGTDLMTGVNLAPGSQSKLFQAINNAVYGPGSVTYDALREWERALTMYLHGYKFCNAAAVLKQQIRDYHGDCMTAEVLIQWRDLAAEIPNVNAHQTLSLVK